MFVIIKVVLSDHVAFVFFLFCISTKWQTSRDLYTTAYVNVQHQKIERECDSNISHGAAATGPHCTCHVSFDLISFCMYYSQLLKRRPDELLLSV